MLAANPGSSGAAAQDPGKSAPDTPANSAAPPAAAEAPPQVQVEGFRSARWGMTEAEVKAAIKKDFDIPPNKIRAQRNAAQRTAILAVTAENLIEGAGTAEIHYIFGYTTKRLIQVNVEWGTPVDPHAEPENVVAAANELRDYLIGAGYDPKTMATNLRLADGSVIVFRGQDAQKHTTLLRLVGMPPAADRAGGAAKSAGVALFLSYVLDAQTPDIFRLKQGQF